VTADNGENLRDHAMPAWNRSQWFGHAATYDHTIRIPLIIRAPGHEPRRIGDQVGLIDVMPTLLDLAGVSEDASPRMQGGSLVPFLEGGTVTDRSWYTYSEQPQTLRTPTWKYIEWVQGGEPVLYDLSADPGETNNVIDQHPEVAQRFRDRLDAFQVRNTRMRQLLFGGR